MFKALFGRPDKNSYAQTRIERAVDGFISSSRVRHLNQALTYEFNQVQQWQSLRLKRQYKHLFDNPSTSVASHFMLDEVYSGEQLALISEDIKRVATKAWKIAPTDLIDAAANTVEAHSLTLQIDEMIAIEFLSLGGFNQLHGSESYVQVLRKPEILAARRHQLHQFSNIATIIEGYLSKHSLYYGLKMTAGVAKKAGVYRLHQFLMRSCTILRDTEGFSDIVKTIQESEIALLNEIEKGNNPFKFMDVNEKSAILA